MLTLFQTKTWKLAGLSGLGVVRRRASRPSTGVPPIASGKRRDCHAHTRAGGLTVSDDTNFSSCRLFKIAHGATFTAHNPHVSSMRAAWLTPPLDLSVESCKGWGCVPKIFLGQRPDRQISGLDSNSER